MIVIVDTGGANIASITNALSRLECPSVLSSNPQEISGADKVILPGVGAALDSMSRLEGYGLVETLRNLTKPTLGICLGMQLLYEHSGEGDTPCLGVVEGDVGAMTKTPGITIPHMGWNKVQIKDSSNPLLKGINEVPRCYFVHSFAGVVNQWTVATFEHGKQYPAMVNKNNFFGTQFHPEKSGEVGAQILRNFLEL